MTLTGGAPIWSPQLKGSFSAWGSSIASATIAGGLLLAAACALAVLHPTGPLGRLGQRAVHEGNQEWLLGRIPTRMPILCHLCHFRETMLSQPESQCSNKRQSGQKHSLEVTASPCLRGAQTQPFRALDLPPFTQLSFLSASYCYP